MCKIKLYYINLTIKNNFFIISIIITIIYVFFKYQAEFYFVITIKCLKI